MEKWSDYNPNNNAAPKDEWQDYAPSDKSYLAEAWEDGSNAFMYNANKLGAGMAAGVANIGEAVGVDMNTSRGVQDFYKQNAEQYDTGDEFIKEAYNPLNYTVGGKGYGLVSSVVGSAFGKEAVDSATTGKDMNMGKASNEAALGLGIDPALKALKAVGGSINSGLRRMLAGADAATLKEVEELQRVAEKHGIELTPATATGSPSLARMEHNLGDSAAAGFGLRQTVNTEREGAEGAITGAFNKMGANGSNTNAGEGFAQATRGLVQDEKQYFSDAFGKMFAKYGDSKVFSIRGVKQEAQKLVSQAERNPIIKNTTAYRDAKALTDTDDLLTWEDWSKLRTHLGGLTQDSMVTGKASTGAYKQMYAQLEDDLRSTVINTGDSGMLSQYNRLIDEYSKYKNIYDGTSAGSRFTKSIVQNKHNPESIGHSINNSTLKAKGALDAGGFDRKTGIPSAKSVSATDALLGSKSPDGKGISMAKFIKNTDKDGFQAVAESPNFGYTIDSSDLFKLHLTDNVVPSRKGTPIKGTKGADSLIMSDLRQIAGAIATKNAHKNNSKTAIYNQINWAKANPISAVFMFAKDAGMSAAYRSDVFKRWLSKGGITKAQYAEGIKKIMETSQASPNKIKATNVLFGAEDEPRTNREKLGL